MALVLLGRRRVGLVRFRNRHHDFVAFPTNLHVLRSHRFGKGYYLFVLTQLSDARTAVFRVLRLLLLLLHADMQRLIIVDLHVDVRWIHIRQISVQFVVILPVAEVERRGVSGVGAKPTAALIEGELLARVANRLIDLVLHSLKIQERIPILVDQ